MRVVVPLAKTNRSDQPSTLALIAIACGTAHDLQAQSGEDTVARTHVVPALGLRVGTPQKFSAAVGVIVGEDWQKNGRDHSHNIGLFVEPGVSAGRASLAFLDHGFGSFGSGFGLAATAMRTWKDPGP